METKFSFLYSTVTDEREAQKIGLALVEKKLAACINIYPKITSIYRWQGKIEQGQETVFIIKTTTDKVPKVIEFVKNNHSYSCPCVVEIPLGQGNPAYLEWIKASV